MQNFISAIRPTSELLHRNYNVYFDFTVFPDKPDPVSDDRRPQQKSQPYVSADELRNWLTTEYIPNFPSDMLSPNEEIAWKAAVAQFPQFALPRDKIFRPIYAEVAPPEWRSEKKPKRSKNTKS